MLKTGEEGFPLNASVLFGRFIMGFSLLIVASGSCSAASHPNLTEKRLRERIVLAKSRFLKGEFNAYVAMWSARMRPMLLEPKEEWQKNVETWQAWLRLEKPTEELLEVQITGLRARAKMQVSVRAKDGSRSYGVVYDYWVFENGDWFLDNASRTQ